MNIVLCDKFYAKYPHGFEGKQVVSINKMVELYRDEKVDMIIICTVFHANEVISELVDLGIPLDNMITGMNLISNLS